MSKRAFTLLVALSLTSCASGARVDNMVAAPVETKPPQSNSKLYKNINIKEVRGGEDTNPMWTSQVGNQAFQKALKKTLQSHQLYTAKDGLML